MSPDADRERTEAARADLKRLSEQSEKLLGASDGNPAEPEDRIEVIGRRIGHIVGYLAGALLLWHLLTTYAF
jgi:hypothetical protein